MMIKLLWQIVITATIEVKLRFCIVLKMNLECKCEEISRIARTARR